MTTIRVTRTVRASREKVWDVLSDLRRVAVFNPAVARAELLSGQSRGIGVRRFCRFANGAEAVEEVTQWEEGESFTLAVEKPPMPVTGMQGAFHVAPKGGCSTTVSAEVQYTPRGGVLGLAMDRLFMRRAVRRMFERALDGLELHIQSGRAIGSDGRPVEPSGLRLDAA
jgi:hypothetical protein